jgi:GTP-binding protein EngB required for normal cell division
VRTADGAAIREVLGDLAGLAGEPDRQALTALLDRLDTARLRVLVAGEAKRGKSTLVNALLGRAVLPTGVLPLTAVPATVVSAAPGDEGLRVTFTDGHTDRYPLSSVAEFGTESGNPGNRRQVSALTVGIDAPILTRGVELVDTPGTGSVYAHNTAAADAALPSMDAAIFVLSADPPVSASERDLLRRVAGLSVALFVVLNKADYLDDASLAQAREFTANVVGDVTGGAPPVYPVSARAALDPGGEQGFKAFEADFLGYLDTGRTTGVQEAVRRHTRRIGQRMLDEVALAARAARLPGAEADAQIAAFGDRLRSVSGRQAGAEDRAHGQSRRLLEALNAAAEQAVPRLADRVGAELTAVLGADLSTAPAAVIERQGRAELTRLVTAAVDSWRHDQARLLEAGLRAIDATLTAELEADLAAVRRAVADLLGVTLALPSPEPRLPGDAGFFYTAYEQVDQAELIAGAVRRHVPGEYGRRLARQRLAGQVAELAGSQTGRARGDLQYQLAEATRRLLADLRRRHDGSVEHLAAALERAIVIRAAAGSGRDRELAALGARERTLRALLGRLPADPDRTGAVAAGDRAARQK